jgi:hypothetical protein
MKDRCIWWPRCGCCENLFVYGFVLRNSEHLIWDLEDLQAAEDLIFFALCCAGKRCPDDEVRRHAKRQLAKPYWDDQKARSLMEH